MEIIKRQTESYLFENSKGQFRAIPFYELSMDEWVVYEKGLPKYLLDFNRRDKPLIQDLTKKLEAGEDLENIVWKLGRFLGKEWTTKHNISETEIPMSQQVEHVELFLLDDLSELFIDLTFVATDNVDFDVLLNEDKLFDTYLSDKIGLESAFIDNFDNLVRLLSFLFKTDITLTELTSNIDKQVYDLTKYKENCITTDEFEEKCQDWIRISDRENNMDEYGNLIGIISYIKQNIDKKNLILITEKRKHCA
jgi:hypothetical protein